MRKTIINIMTIAALLFGTAATHNANAQIFLTDEDMQSSMRTVTPENELPIIPELGLTIDQYAPATGGVLVLSLLGGAYLLGKRKKKEA